MQCRCGGKREVKITEEDVAVVQCVSCGRGTCIPQPTLYEVQRYRAEVRRIKEIRG